MSYFPRFLTFLLLSIFLVSSSPAETATFPAALANAEGRSLQNGVESPVGPWRNEVSKAHSIYDSAPFAASGPGRVRVTKFQLRPDGDSNVGSFIGFDNLKFVFAVTPTAPNHLQGMFASNLAAVVSEPVTVYDQSWESEVVNPLPSIGTRPFDFEVELTTPFEFDPSDGNLLVEWVIGLPTHAETRFDFDDSVWGQYPDHATQIAFGVDPTGGGGVGGFGVVTQFEFEPVPEPDFGFLTAVIGLGLASQLRRKC